MFKRFFVTLGSILLLSFPQVATAQTTASQAVTGQYQNAPQTNCTVGPCFTNNNPPYVASTALAANKVLKATSGNLYSFNVTADSTLYASDWYVLIYDATAAPTDGAVTPAKCYHLFPNTATLMAAFPNPVPFTTGIVIGVSTTGCFTKTASTHAFISGDAN